MRRIHRHREKVTITVRLKGADTKIRHPLRRKLKLILVINNQFTNAANTTQIASGAGRSSAAGNNAAIDSSNTEQQQSVGAGGTAENTGIRGKQSESHPRPPKHHRHHRMHPKPPKHHKHPEHRRRRKDRIVLVLNNQINRSDNPQSESAATQVASGGATFSAGGTNAAIEGSNTKQQHAAGGAPGAQASNKGMNSDQIEAYGAGSFPDTD